MKSNGSIRAAAGRTLFRVLAVCIAALMLLNVAGGQEADAPPSVGARGMPGALGTFEFRPDDWRPGTSYWVDTDGVNPGVPGCHIGVTQDGQPNGRTFGEACTGNGLLIESNPGPNQIHPHPNDIGHPDLFDCNAWCAGARNAGGGICRPVNGPAPCAQSAFCECR